MTLTRKTLFLLTAAFGTHSLQTASADAVVKAEKLHASANRSYKVAEFTQTGNASWYGGRFHGRKTSGGDRYDMNAFTAAHKTLPIPSHVRVTNTKNGKSVIDVSKAAAQKLGFVSQGTAHVKIEQIVPGQSAPVAENKDIFIDLKSFGTEHEAQAYLNQAAQNFAASSSSPNLSVEKRRYEYVVKMGPFASQERAAEAEAQARGMVRAVLTSG
ncbi:septal ring lytic transglycosylase RlpA family protein [Neisseria gonorrhoeae]|uniref:septal ring lytic transglycosylase RlpA family protein n=1 Tax=Neisseria gonorrhoeae TaxID=485 RepID=UPI0008DC0F06|nr:septal ring lytic transglycosylase RlpA family protein [Neisseria gonorrhoeae]AZG19010.1 septal ring lytic transglycosylase RlpA family protein [Neisseria gonorrhoeae]AZG25911.1 septal ring lytic transglycosylase RlpA family protein [Neisseria gonorrhoeae]AZG42770.1 septal ring lytic transglycosylase RlpA family protein [Neisseria gonorrhoeae]MCU9853283.1 septal ring lytic transglycosylase RlpA family protein [Neisseria gonorrhoeae]MCU9889847.1 septal ring lytic transglycosylase RlpA family